MHDERISVAATTFTAATAVAIAAGRCNDCEAREGKQTS
jgi:hypothetical protein